MSIAGIALMLGAITWRELPPLPQALGGQFVGVIGERLVVAGGSYWTASQWEGGKKVWVDTIYTLGRGETEWRLAGRLPEPAGYGAAVSDDSGLLLFGGQTPAGVSRTILHLSFVRGKLHVQRFVDLPEPLMLMGSAVVSGTVYLAGGQETITPAAVNSFWSVSLSELTKKKPAWTKLPTWPGPSRFLPQMAHGDGAVYLIGGADLQPPSGRVFLKDAYKFTPESGWEKLPDFPRPVQAGTAAFFGGQLLVFGGSDGMLAPFETEVKDDHPGFDTMVWRLDLERSRWVPFSRMPVSLVTTGLVQWGDELVIAGGEDRPGHRSARVIAAKRKKTP